MAFKGTWHRADAGGGGAPSNDRRFPSTNDSYSSFAGIQGNQMNLGSMNYPNNSNAMYPVISTGTLMNYPSANKSSLYKGTISNIFRDYGVIDNEISFKFNAVIGALPRVGDRVVCQMKPAEGFGSQTPYKYYGFDVRSAETPADNRRTQRPSGGSSVSRNSQTYINRNQSTNVKRSLPSNTNNNRERHAPINNGSNIERHRSDSNRRSHSRNTQIIASKRTIRSSLPKYNCTLPKASLDCSQFNVTDIRCRYARLHIPSDFYHASYTWHQSIPLDRPVKFVTPCSFHVFSKNVTRLSADPPANISPIDADYTWNVRVMLMSTPDIESLITRSCLIHSDNGKHSSINPDDLEHPTKLIKFLVGVRYTNEYFPLGGPWSPSLDGPNPDTDSQVLIRTAIRCVHGQTGIDLSKCLQWCRYLEVRYHRPEEIHKGRLIESRVENIVVLLPDIASTCMPTSLEWEQTTAMYKQKCAEDIAEELNEIQTSDDEIEVRCPSHYSAIDIDNLRIIDLRAELKARGQALTGLKIDLKKRLTKLIEQEKINEEKQTEPTTTTTTTNDDIQSIDIKESTQSDIDKMRKEIELKYQIPIHRSIVVHPTSIKGDKFDCRVVSLHYLLNYANKDTIKEKSFELYLFSEAFNEMLMRDYTYEIYRALFSCLEVTDNTNTNEQSQSITTINNNASIEMETNNDEENEKKRKRTTSQDDDESGQKKKITTTTTNEPISTTIEIRSKTIHPQLLLSFTYFDRNRCGYLLEKDLEEILLLSGLSLTKNETKLLVSRISSNEKVQYHKLTDKDMPIDDKQSIEIRDNDIDSLAPKGNLCHLPDSLVIFGIRTKSNIEHDQLYHSIDNQRAMKQLELSTKIQTNLELKIDSLKINVQQITDDLHSTQKTNRLLNEQLTDTKKRLRDTQHDFKELDEKYKRYSDALYRVRSETRSTFDHLTHVLAIKDKQSTQIDNKKSKSNDEQSTGKTDEQPTTKIQESVENPTNPTEQ